MLFYAFGLCISPIAKTERYRAIVFEKNRCGKLALSPRAPKSTH